jgi:hypothetical protein
MHWRENELRGAWPVDPQLTIKPACRRLVAAIAHNPDDLTAFRATTHANSTGSAIFFRAETHSGALLRPQLDEMKEVEI